ncbi:MAG: hypothetical protein MKZ81_02600 [Dehalococcoidia bacterium]|nr:hypothetical protein [Dehalococcoidia bacterium]
MTIWINHYSVVDSQAVENGPWIIDQKNQRNGIEERLLILVEPVSDDSTSVCNEIAQAVATLFFREKLSVTGALLRSLRQADHNLKEWNKRSLREHHVSVGLTCIVITDQEVVIAQVGPSLGYIISDEQANPLRTKNYPAVIPLGGEGIIQPLFSKLSLDEEYILFFSSFLENELSEEELAFCLNSSPSQCLGELYSRTRDVKDMAAIVLAMALEENRVQSLIHDNIPLDSGSEKIVAIGTEQKNNSLISRNPKDYLKTHQPRSFRGIFSLRRILMAIAVTFSLILVSIGWTFFSGLLEEDIAAKFNESISSARENVEVFNDSNSIEIRRSALNNALTELEHARALSPENDAAKLLQGQILDLLRTLDAVIEIKDFDATIRLMGLITTPFQPVDIIAGKSSLWLHDSAQGRIFVISQDLVPEFIEVYRAGEIYDSVSAGYPLVLTFDSTNERFLLIDQYRQLWSINSNGIVSSLTLRGINEIQDITSIDTFQGNLYLLDAFSNEVWRYVPVGKNFDSERSSVLGSVRLRDPLELFVDSSSVYVLDDVTVRRFAQGVETNNLFEGIDNIPSAVDAMVGASNQELIFLIDRGNGRIIVSEQDGAFVKQYRNPNFSDLRSIAISDDEGILFVLTGTELHLFRLSNN